MFKILSCPPKEILDTTCNTEDMFALSQEKDRFVPCSSARLDE